MSQNIQILFQQFSSLTTAFHILVRSKTFKEIFRKIPNDYRTVSIFHNVSSGENSNVDENNSIFLSYSDLVRLRLWPYATYTATFQYNLKESEKFEWIVKKRVVFIVPTNQVKSGCIYVSKNLWFNICGSISINFLQMKFTKALEIHVSKLSHISVIKSTDYPVDFKLEEHAKVIEFFEKPRLFYDGDIFCIYIEISGVNTFVYFKHYSNETPCLVNQTTSLYQISSENGNFPGQRIFPTRDFVPQTLLRISHEIENVVHPIALPIPSRPTPLVLVIAGCGIPLLLKYLADRLCVNLVEIDCYDFWSLDGRVPDKAISEAIDKAKNYSPCLCVFDGVSVLEEASQAKIESGNRTLELLRNSINTLPHNAIVIFTCPTIDLPNLSTTIAEMVHFEYIINSLTKEDKMDFAKFMFRKEEKTNFTWFSNNTRGFLLAELNQLVAVARANAFVYGRTKITQEDLQYGIDKRNKAFGEVVGVPKIPNVKWEDVGGMDDVKKIIAESLRMNMKRKGLRRSGIVLFGPPGCGKTLIAKAVANEFDITFLSVKGPELLNQYVGQSEQNLRTIFEKARLASPSILFFDELDSLAPNRGVTGDSGGVMDRIVSQLLTELDSLHSKINCEVFVMAATNRPDLLDPCLLTPGRFDKVVYVKPATDLESKIRILKAACKNLRLGKDAKKCPDLMSGADLSSLMSKASIYALKQAITRIEQGVENLKTAQIKISMQHVNLALEEFSGSLSQADVERYSKLENVF